MTYNKTYFAICMAALFLTGCGLENVEIDNTLNEPSLKIPSERYALSDTELIYSYDEMFSFDVAAYLNENAPHLGSYAESISHFAGYHAINPKILIAIMEMQSGIVSQSTSDSINEPFRSLSDQLGFDAQLNDIAERLAFRLADKTTEPIGYSNPPATVDKNKILKELLGLRSANRASSGESSIAELTAIYATLFGPITDNSSTTRDSIQDFNIESSSDLPNSLQLPFPIGEYWSVGGSHTHTGSGSFPMSSLDMHRFGRWGDDISHLFVTAAADGVVKVHSSCFMEIIHDSGWSTTYYHLSNIVVKDGERVERNDNIANYANTIQQALCNGGHSTGPHLHFSVKKDGQYIHMDGEALSGYEVHTGRHSYDTDCNYFWLEREGQRHCAHSLIFNHGVPDSEPTVAWLDNGKSVTDLSVSNQEVRYFGIEVPRNALSLSITTKNGQGHLRLFVTHGLLPNDQDHICSASQPNVGEQTCFIEKPDSGEWYIAIMGDPSFSFAEINAEFEIESNTKPSLPVHEPFIFLSDLTPVESINGWGPIEKDTSNGETAQGDGSPIAIAGVSYEKGLGVHSYSTITYDLTARHYTNFSSFVGVDDSRSWRGSVSFEVYVDDVLLESTGTMFGGDPAKEISITLTPENKTLRLVATDGGDGNSSDHANWADAKLTLADNPKSDDFVPGLYYGEVVGPMNTAASNPKQHVTWSMLETEGSIDPSTTLVFTGYIYDADGQISFYENIDDNVRLWINDTLVLSDDNWNQPTSTGNLNLNPGWNRIELRIGNGNGPGGPFGSLGIGFDPSGGANWKHLADDGNGSILQTKVINY